MMPDILLSHTSVLSSSLGHQLFGPESLFVSGMTRKELLGRREGMEGDGGEEEGREGSRGEGREEGQGPSLPLCQP